MDLSFKFFDPKIHRACAQDLDVEAIVDLLSDCYDHWQIFTDMGDVGLSGTSRRRTYIIFARKGATRCYIVLWTLRTFCSGMVETEHRRSLATSCPQNLSRFCWRHRRCAEHGK